MEISAEEIVPRNGNHEQVIRNLSNNIYLLRHYRKMRRGEFAKQIESVTPRVSALENGGLAPKLKDLSRIAEVLGTTPGRLLDVNSRRYLEEGRFYLLFDHSRRLEYPPGELFPKEVRAFVEGNFF